MLRQGMAGQAAEMRGEPNAFGIVTKAKPDMTENSFFHDGNARDEQAIRLDLIALGRTLKTNKFTALVVPAAGLGSGLARLHIFAPKLFAELNDWKGFVRDL